MMNQIKYIEVNNVTIKYHHHTAVKNVTFTINKGDFIGVIGENGSGKTTLIKALLGVIDINGGTVKFLEGLKIGYLPQNIMQADTVFPATAEEVALVGILDEKKFPKIINKSDRLRVKKVFSELGISELLKKRIGNLSGGQQQRVMLARALVNEPDILFLDEPTSALDSIIENSFLKILQNLNKTRNTTIVIITHDLVSVGGYINRIIYMNQSLEYVGSFDDFCKNTTHSPYIHLHAKSACGHDVITKEMKK